MDTSNDEHLLIHAAPRYVVGIGASAGGLESLELFFRNLPPNTGMAFVVLQHLSPDFKSMMFDSFVQADSTANFSARDLEAPVKPMKIVLVEDGDDNRRMLKALLELDGHEVVAVANGEIGMEAIRIHRPDIALIDIGLPGISGYDVARIISQDEQCRHTMLVALTGYGQESDVARAIEH